MAIVNDETTYKSKYTAEEIEGFFEKIDEVINTIETAERLLDSINGTSSV